MSDEAPSVTVEKRAAKSLDRASVSTSDVKLTALLPALAALSWFAPARQWPALCRGLLVRTPGTPSADSIQRGVALSGLEGDLSLSAGEISQALHVNRYVSYLQYLRDYAPGGWPCRAEIGGGGEAQLRAARDGQSGAILWVAHFVYNGLPLKKALRQAGYSVHHMSRPEHGFSDTAYGIRVLNPIRSRIEERYLARRVIIKRGAEHVALREAHRLVSQGNLVSFTAGHWEGRQIGRIPVGNALLPVSTGAPSLAHATGAPLLPVFIRQEEDGGFQVTIGKAIPCGKPAPREEAVSSALAEFAAQLVPQIAHAPGQWRGWKYLTPRS